MGGDARGSKPNNSELNHMDQVGGAQLAYAAVQVRFPSRQQCFAQTTNNCYIGPLRHQLKEPVGRKGRCLQLPQVLLLFDRNNR